MGSGHSHGAHLGHDSATRDGDPEGALRSAGAGHLTRLALAFALTAGFFLVELIAGLASGSLALLSDAGHMGADVVALGAALLAIVVANRPDPSGRWTYGRYRIEIFASGLAVLIMAGMGVYVLVEALGRIGSEAQVATGTMLVVGALGLVVNFCSLLLLRTGSTESLAVRGAYLEVLADAAGSVGVIAAALLIRATGTPIWDLVVAVCIAVFIVVRAVMLGRGVLAVLGQHAPEGMEPREVVGELAALDEVRAVHDFHVWTLTSGMDVVTVHLVVDAAADQAAVLDRAGEVLAERGLHHATIQIEVEGRSLCRTPGW